VDVVHGNLSATGDIQFDITQVAPKYYGNFIGFDPNIFDDLGGTKYNDFTIGADTRGEYPNLGAQGVADAQTRLAQDGILRLGLTLSGSDFDLPVYQFHGIVFAPSAEHTLCITYTLRDFGDLPEPKFATDLAGGLVGPSHGMDSLDIDPRPTVQPMFNLPCSLAQLLPMQKEMPSLPYWQMATITTRPTTKTSTAPGLPTQPTC